MNSKSALDTLVETIRTCLLSGKDAVVPGLGTFTARQSNSRLSDVPGRAVKIEPPKRQIVFLPDVDG